MEQHFEYERPIRPGDVLTVTTRDGNTWERESKRAGKLMFSERITEYRDQNGDLVYGPQRRCQNRTPGRTKLSWWERSK